MNVNNNGNRVTLVSSSSSGSSSAEETGRSGYSSSGSGSDNEISELETGDDRKPRARSNGDAKVSDDNANSADELTFDYYRDYSQLPPLPGKEGKRRPDSKVEPTFPVKLHMILSNPKHEDIIRWLPHGRSWCILDQKALEENVIPLYFRHVKYSSFARQVNGWGFKRIVSGCDYNSYFHPLFLRGVPHLCDRIRRPKKASTGSKSDSSVTAKDALEQKPPDLYGMTRKHPLPTLRDASGMPAKTSSYDTVHGKVHRSLQSAGISHIKECSAEMHELIAIEKRRNEILQRMNGGPVPANTSAVASATASSQLVPHQALPDYSTVSNQAAPLQTQVEVTQPSPSVPSSTPDIIQAIQALLPLLAGQTHPRPAQLLQHHQEQDSLAKTLQMLIANSNSPASADIMTALVGLVQLLSNKNSSQGDGLPPTQQQQHVHHAPTAPMMQIPRNDADLLMNMISNHASTARMNEAPPPPPQQQRPAEENSTQVNGVSVEDLIRLLVNR